MDGQAPRRHVPDVVDHDDRHDGAQRRPDDSFVRDGQPAAAREAAPWVPTGIFAAGYLAAWGGIQRARDRPPVAPGPIRPDDHGHGERRGLARRGAPSLAAGTWQLTPLKHACLEPLPEPFRICQPALAARPGGCVSHGVRSTAATASACCWAVMGLLFYAGVMNFAWIAGLAISFSLRSCCRRGTVSARSADTFSWPGASG